MLVPRGRFYRRQKRARGPARLRFFARCGPSPQGGPVRPQPHARHAPAPLSARTHTKTRTSALRRAAVRAVRVAAVWPAVGRGAGQWPAALPLLIGHRIIVIRPQGNRIHTRASEYTADHTYMRSSKIQRERERERERERGERERERALCSRAWSCMSRC